MLHAGADPIELTLPGMPYATSYVPTIDTDRPTGEPLSTDEIAGGSSDCSCPDGPCGCCAPGVTRWSPPQFGGRSQQFVTGPIRTGAATSPDRVSIRTAVAPYRRRTGSASAPSRIGPRRPRRPVAARESMKSHVDHVDLVQVLDTVDPTDDRLHGDVRRCQPAQCAVRPHGQTLPRDGSVPIPDVSTASTRSAGQAARTRSFQAARSLATVRSVFTARDAAAAGA